MHGECQSRTCLLSCCKATVGFVSRSISSSDRPPVLTRIHDVGDGDVGCSMFLVVLAGSSDGSAGRKTNENV